MQIGCYFESWRMPWASSTTNDLTKLQAGLNTVYLSFARPDLLYIKGQNSFSGTGLEFSSEFKTIKDSIKVLQDRNVKVLLAVGGGEYWSVRKTVNILGVVDLANDLGCDGIDIDWEVGTSDDDTPIAVIDNLRKHMPEKIISFTCFSTGAYLPSQNDPFSGMNVKAIKQCSKLIDQVNVMCYDAGANFDTVKAIRAYQELYKGQVNIGFQIGKQGWGDALLKKEELVKVCTVLKAPKIGSFFWAYYSQPYEGSISRPDAVNEVFKLAAPKKPTYSLPSSVYIICPKCTTNIKCAWSVDNV